MTEELVVLNSNGGLALGSAKNGKRRIVVVLGMHRSGTSLLTNLLTFLGVDLGADLLAANVHNEMGYWENEPIYRTQDALMNHLAKDWGDFGFAYPFAFDWKRLPELRSFQDQLTSIVRAELARAKGIWGFKDPRTCRLLPMWKQIFAELDLEPLYVLAVRNPSVVVESLLKMYPLDPLHAELVWLLYNMDALGDAGRELRVVVDYDRWFTAPREQAQAVAKALDLAWPADDREFLARLTQTIRPDLRHSKARHSCSLPFVSRAYEALQQAAAAGEVPDLSASGGLLHARECLGAALELSSGAGKIALAVGHAELQAGNLEAALAACTRAVRLQPRLAAAHASLGFILQSMGRWTEAFDSARQAIALDPTNGVALKTLAALHLHKGEYEAAEKTCQRVLQQTAEDTHALQMLRQALQEKENTNRAAELFNRATKVFAAPRIEPAPIRFRKERTSRDRS